MSAGSRGCGLLIENVKVTLRGRHRGQVSAVSMNGSDPVCASHSCPDSDSCSEKDCIASSYLEIYSCRDRRYDSCSYLTNNFCFCLTCLPYLLTWSLFSSSSSSRRTQPTIRSIPRSR